MTFDRRRFSISHRNSQSFLLNEWHARAIVHFLLLFVVYSAHIIDVIILPLLLLYLDRYKAVCILYIAISTYSKGPLTINNDRLFKRRQTARILLLFSLVACATLSI